MAGCAAHFDASTTERLVESLNFTERFPRHPNSVLAPIHLHPGAIMIGLEDVDGADGTAAQVALLKIDGLFATAPAGHDGWAVVQVGAATDELLIHVFTSLRAAYTAFRALQVD